VQMRVLLLLPIIISFAASNNAGAAQTSLTSNGTQTSGFADVVVSGSAPGSRLEFFEGVSPLGALSVNRLGQASFTVQGLSPGAHAIFAKERGAGTQAGEVLHVTIPAAATDRFSSAAGSALGIQPTAFAAGDLNRDGTADFVAAGNGYVSLLRGLGSGLFSPVIFAAVADPTSGKLER